jgi:predicted RNA-binding Zn-ribbon protein involved in translation (DUF1610 family)
VFRRRRAAAAKQEQEVIAAIEVASFTAPFCPGCGVSFSEPYVRVFAMTQIKDGWLTQGHIAGDASCPSCGEVYSAVCDYIPVECAEFRCPKCGPDAPMKPDVLVVTKAEDGYLFRATLKCARCSRPHIFRKAVQSLAKVRRLKVGPTGIEVELSDR